MPDDPNGDQRGSETGEQLYRLCGRRNGEPKQRIDEAVDAEMANVWLRSMVAGRSPGEIFWLERVSGEGEVSVGGGFTLIEERRLHEPVILGIDLASEPDRSGYWPQPPSRVCAGRRQVGIEQERRRQALDRPAGRLDQREEIRPKPAGHPLQSLSRLIQRGIIRAWPVLQRWMVYALCALIGGAAVIGAAFLADTFMG